MKALIIGATGATGRDLLRMLLQDAAYGEVVIFVRRASGLTRAGVTEIVTDFDNIEAVAEQIRGDAWFSCLGTTRKLAGSRDKQWQVDYEIPAKFAEVAKRNGVRAAVLLSAYGASSTSNIFYSRMKGALEDKIESLAFDQYIIFRPGLLQRRNSDRAGERISAGILNFLNSIGLFKKFRPVPTEVLAAKMAKAPRALGAGRHVVSLDRIVSL
ncbi:NAD(P)H-binding protein [Flavihumibacter petaseus]|uniref:Putative oxidoreductase n=1 Tax=Flavihumibacter petaseus NBRC 106054 TaxID=1220578 RepID=A0A0E9N3X0_9BACT|nr:NAD(P)H-binding protein [Flavihumibacter petaseus]GAO44682.1 putative oxidoreductase [Flavihumibacter petaseus NBRC 106054]